MAETLERYLSAVGRSIQIRQNSRHSGRDRRLLLQLDRGPENGDMLDILQRLDTAHRTGSTEIAVRVTVATLQYC